MPYYIVSLVYVTITSLLIKSFFHYSGVDQTYQLIPNKIILMAECHLCHPQLSPCRLLPSNWRIVDTRHSSVLRVCYMSLDWVNIYIYLKSIVQTIRDNCCPPTVNRTRRPILIMNQCNCFHFKSH